MFSSPSAGNTLGDAQTPARVARAYFLWEP